LEVILVLVVGISAFLIANVFGLSMDCSHRSKNVSWDTGYVSLQADEFRIIADGKNFYANVYEVDVNSGSKSETRRTLELEWDENGVEMRCYIYLYANESYWWADEIWTYNGQENDDDVDWIYYTGTFFKTSLGTAFTGDVDLKSDEYNAYKGEIHIKNLTLQAF